MLTPIGFVHSTRKTPDDDGWDAIPSSIELCDPYTPDSLAGLQDFSHVEVIYLEPFISSGSTPSTARPSTISSRG